MKRSSVLIFMLAALLVLGACAAEPTGSAGSTVPADAVEIVLGDGGISVGGQPASDQPGSAVYVANDIVFYESGKDFTYGEGTEADAHTAQEASAHTVVHISQPGAYSVSGKLSRGQIAVDLGKDAKDDPEAVVTLILNGVDITCEVAPAVIFYNVYECGSDDADKATRDVSTAAAGANVIIADATSNTVRGSYVARVYKPGSVVLNQDGTAVEDAKKLHKYDGAFYSKMSMNVGDGGKGTGELNIYAENEGLDSELHLTLNGGNINIFSGNDGINTNEDGVSVTTVNGGTLTVRVTGETGEGDGIDSNGWLVINGGTVIAAACTNSADAGIDSDMGIHINGGTVLSSGHMLDRIQDGGQTYAVFNFLKKQSGDQTLSLKNAAGKTVMQFCPENDYSVVVFSSADLSAGTYTLWCGEQQMAGQGGGSFGRPGMPEGMSFPEGMTPPEGMSVPEGMTRPEGMTPPEGMSVPEGMTRPEGMTPPEGMSFPEGMTPPEGMSFPEGMTRPEGMTPSDRPGGGRWDQGASGTEAAQTEEFELVNGANMFGNISVAQTA